MPLDYHIDDERGLLITRASGIIKDSQLASLHKRMLKDARLRPDLDQLGDYRGASTQAVTSKCVRTLAQTPLLGPGARRAFVADNPDTFVLLSVYQHLIDGSEEVRVFRNMQEALVWLGRTPSGAWFLK